MRTSLQVSFLIYATLGLVFCAIAGVISGAESDHDTKSLRVAIKSIKPFVYADEIPPRGFSIDIVDKIARDLNKRVEYVVVSTVQELLDAVHNQTVDFSIAAITVTAKRELHVDFSHPYCRSGLRIAVPLPGGSTWRATLERIFSADLLVMLGTLFGLALFTAHLLWIIERNINPQCFPATYVGGIGEAMWWSVATIITGGCENKAPVSLLGRMVAVAWMLGSIVLVASFTATLASQMTAENLAGAISGPKDLYGRRVATVQGTAVVEDLRAIQAIVLSCPTLNDAIDSVASGKADAVVFDAPVLANAIMEINRCPVRIVGPIFEHQDYAIALPPGAPLRKQINQILLTLAETDELAKLNLIWFGDKE
jgi:polar amino acid transport system substrate-binding protein